MLLFTYSISLVIQFFPKDRGKLDGFLHLILLLRLGNAYFERYYSQGWGVVARDFEGFVLEGIAEPSKGNRAKSLHHGSQIRYEHKLFWCSNRGAGIAEFVATFLFLYITVLTVMGVSQSKTKCATVGIQGIAWAFGGMIFALVYCTAGISGGHINPAVTFGLFLARKLSLTRAVFYMIMQCLGAICGAGVVKGFQGDNRYEMLGGGANVVNHGYTKGDGLGAEIIATFVLVYTVFSATDAKRNARDSHVPILAPLPIGFAVFLVHLATIPITGTGINPARSLGAAIIYNKDHAWDDHVSIIPHSLLFLSFGIVKTD
ncbi:hypothetical protein V6Z12_A08G207900 [Gossypium hirsutum]